MKRRINIEIVGKEISDTEAVTAVASVIAQGRISGDENTYCYVTVFNTYCYVTVFKNGLEVFAKRNSETSDSFKLCRPEEV